MKKFAFLTTLIALAFVSNVSAQEIEKKDRKGPASVAEVFEKLDVDSDGFIAQAEAKGPLQRNFASIDTNNDGLISTIELENAPKLKGRQNGGKMGKGNKRNRPSVVEIFEKSDANLDGFIDQTEAPSRLQRNFASIDTNNDGLISTVELENAPKPERRRGRNKQKNENGLDNQN